jgi:uncharacterized protein YkvS
MKRTIIISLIVALIFFTLGYLIGGAKVNPTGQLVKGANTFQAGWEAAKKRLTESGFSPIMGNNLEIKSVFGQVKKIEGKNITLKIRSLEPLADPNLDERTVVVNENTKIYQLEQKNQKDYQKEMDEFNKKLQEQTKTSALGQIGLLTPPEFFTKKTVALADIKVGQQLTVIAADNIKEAKEIKALEISLQFIPSSIPSASNILPTAPLTTVPPVPPAAPVQPPAAAK